MSESNRIEYKRELTDSLEKEVVAFFMGGAMSSRKTPKAYRGQLEIFKKRGLPEVKTFPVTRHMGFSDEWKTLSIWEKEESP